MKIEIKRQLVHLLLGIVYIILFLFLDQSTALVGLLLIFGLGSLISYTHAHVKPLPFLKDILEKVERNKEKHIPGRAALTFTLGIILASILFSQLDKLVIVGAIIAVTFGDGFSTLIGKWFGKMKTLGNRTMEGTLAGIGAATLVLLLFFPIEIALAVAIFAMLAEYLPINDSYTIPIVSGVVLALIL